MNWQPRRGINNRLSRLLLVLSLILTIEAAGWLNLPVSAQDSGQTLVYDTRVEGQITDAAIEQTWTLEAPGRDIIAIVVERTEGTLVPIFELRDGNNQQITQSSPDNTMARAVSMSIQLPAAGTYYVVVGKYRGQDGKTSGKYNLSVFLQGAGEDNPGVEGNAGMINYGEPTTGELTNAKWRDLWTLETISSDMISITATCTEGTLMPLVELLDGNMNQVPQYGGYGGTQPGGDGTYTISHVKLNGVGQYFIRVSRADRQSGSSTGKYTLTVTLDGTGSEQLQLFKSKGSVTVDKPVTGELTNEQWVNVWTYETQSRDRIRVSAVRTEGNLRPTLSIRTSNGQEVQQDRESSITTRDEAQADVTLPGPGRYQIRVNRYDDEIGLSTGKYQLSVFVLALGEDNAIFRTSVGTIESGKPVQGSLDNVKWKNSWTITIPQENTMLTVVAKRASGTLVPRVAIVGATGQEIMRGEPDETYTTATIETYRVPGTGKYTIVVLRDGERDGGSTGSYELTVTASRQ